MLLNCTRTNLIIWIKGIKPALNPSAMITRTSSKSYLPLFLLVFSSFLLSGCVYWRLYQTKEQMVEFDKNFNILDDKGFSLVFNDPKIFKNDIDYLTQLTPTFLLSTPQGKHSNYSFYKVDEQNRKLSPEVVLSFDMLFNHEELLETWVLAPIFLEIAPPEFLEISLRSLGSAEIYKARRQLKADTSSLEKIDTELPIREDILKTFGAPLETKQHDDRRIDRYHFLLDSPKLNKDNMERALTVVELYFDPATEQLMKMKGRFAGLKISINYQKLTQKDKKSG